MTRLPKTVAVHSVPKWSGFDVPVPNVEPPAEGKEVEMTYSDTTGLELLLEVEIKGKCHQMLVDSGASLSVIKPGSSSSELKPTQTAAIEITGNKLKAVGIQEITFRVGKRHSDMNF